MWVLLFLVSLCFRTVEGLKIVLALNATPDSLNKQKWLTSKELAGKSGSFAVNGFPTSESR